MPSVNAEQAKADVQSQLNKWMAKCTKKGSTGHDTTHGGTNAFGTGYPTASEREPATILETEWETLKDWWSKLSIDLHYNKWNIGSFGGVSGVQDLCCACSACPKIMKPDFNSPTGKSAKDRTFVYHLKVVKVLPVVAPPPIAVPGKIGEQ